MVDFLFARLLFPTIKAEEKIFKLVLEIVLLFIFLPGISLYSESFFFLRFFRLKV